MLQLGAGGSFYEPLQPGTISHWIARDSRGASLQKWTDSVLTKVANGGRHNITVPHLGHPRAMVNLCSSL